MEIEKIINLKHRAITATILVIIICILWYNLKSISQAQAQDVPPKKEIALHVIDVSSAQEDPDGCAALIKKDIDLYPELTFVNAFISKQSPKGVILKYGILYRR